ncbi:MAG: DUF302 domain-containing protein [Chloroflexota bacterium]
MQPVNYGIVRTIEATFEDAKSLITEKLAAEGFGILSEIDVQATLKKKLDFDFKPYTILGACNPPLAKRALLAEPAIGLMLPCNVIVTDEGEGRVSIAAMDPKAAMATIGNPELDEVAAEVREKLERVMAAL